SGLIYGIRTFVPVDKLTPTKSDFAIQVSIWPHPPALKIGVGNDAASSAIASSRTQAMWSLAKQTQVDLRHDSARIAKDAVAYNFFWYLTHYHRDWQLAVEPQYDFGTRGGSQTLLKDDSKPEECNYFREHDIQDLLRGA